MKKKKIIIFVFFIIFSIFSLFFPYNIFINYENGMVVTQNEFYDIINDSNFIVTTSAYMASASTDENFDDYVVRYKLFNLFNIKKLKVKVIEPDRYFAGGNSLGFSLQSRGIILMGGNFIITEYGIVRPFEDSKLQSGDIIYAIDNIEINNVADISKILSSYTNGQLKLSINRNGEHLIIPITPALDSITGTYKLGLWVKEDAVGIGTLTFLNATTHRFGSLGHSINDTETNECIEVSGGNIYKSKILGVKKGYSGKAGELMGTFSRDNVIGSVDKNCEYGVYGYIDNIEEVTKDKTSIQIGGRKSAKPGKAQILTCIDGQNIESFNIEIIKTNFQSSQNEKSMVIKVTDKNLIERTGGIVQGMSGSPIIQDGKLIGAVTHVFVNDATKGFGLYIDWMLNI